jgi:hypothetical protein
MPMHESCELEIDRAANSLSGKTLFLASAQPSVMGTHTSGAGFITQGGVVMLRKLVGVAATALLTMTASPSVSAQRLEIGPNKVRMHQSDRVLPDMRISERQAIRIARHEGLRDVDSVDAPAWSM